VGVVVAGVIVVVSAEFRSGKDMLNQIYPLTAPRFLDRGYVVFMVTHGSQPRFAVPEIVGDIHRTVRFIKANAKKYNVDPDKLGIADRGRLKEGFAADVTVFDQDRVIDRATFEQPHQFPVGIKYVIVNGVVTVDNERHTGALAGQVIYGPAKRRAESKR